MNSNQEIKYKKKIQELEKELSELREEAGKLLSKFIRYSNLTDTEIKRLERENDQLRKGKK